MSKCSRKIESIGSCETPVTGEEMLVYVKWVGEPTATWEFLKHIPFYLGNMYTHVAYKNQYTDITTFSEIRHIVDAQYNKHHNINILLYFVGNMKPSWESVEYVIKNGVNQNPVLTIKHSVSNTLNTEKQVESQEEQNIDDSHPKFETKALCTVS